MDYSGGKKRERRSSSSFIVLDDDKNERELVSRITVRTFEALRLNLQTGLGGLEAE